MTVSELYQILRLAPADGELCIELRDRRTLIPLEGVLLADDGRVIFQTRPEKLSAKAMKALEETGEYEEVRTIRKPRRGKKP